MSIAMNCLKHYWHPLFVPLKKFPLKIMINQPYSSGTSSTKSAIETSKVFAIRINVLTVGL
jgi:hypothetical protein